MCNSFFPTNAAYLQIVEVCLFLPSIRKRIEQNFFFVHLWFEIFDIVERKPREEYFESNGSNRERQNTSILIILAYVIEYK